MELQADVLLMYNFPLEGIIEGCGESGGTGEGQGVLDGVPKGMIFE